MENKSEVSLDFIGFNPLDYLGFKQEQKHVAFPFQICAFWIRFELTQKKMILKEDHFKSFSESGDLIDLFDLQWETKFTLVSGNHSQNSLKTFFS